MRSLPGNDHPRREYAIPVLESAIKCVIHHKLMPLEELKVSEDTAGSLGAADNGPQHTMERIRALFKKKRTIANSRLVTLQASRHGIGHVSSNGGKSTLP
jgi:hypothetical protein